MANIQADFGTNLAREGDRARARVAVVSGDAFQPWNRQDDAQRNALVREATARTIFTQDMNAALSGTPGNRILSGSAATLLAQTGEKSPEKKWEKEAWAAAFKAAREALQERIRKLEADLAESKRRVAEFDRQLAAIAQLEKLQKDGKLDPSEPAQAALIGQAGLSPEELQGGDAAAILAARRSTVQGAREDEFRKQQKIQTQLDKEKQAAARYDANPNDPAMQSEILELRKTPDGVTRLGGAAFNSQRQVTKDELADAVGRAEAASDRAGSLEITSESVAAESSSEFAGHESDSFDLDAPLPAGAATASAASSIAPTASFANAPDAGAAFASASGQSATPSQQLADNSNILRPVQLTPPPPKAG